MSPIRTVCQESTRPGTTVFGSRTSALGVAERDNHGTSEGSHPNGPTASRVEAG